MTGLERWDHARDGEPTESALRRRLEERGFRVVRYVYPPGTVFLTHAHDADRADAVVTGKLRLSANGQEIDLEAGDLLCVSRGTPHRAEVVGDEPVVSLDAERPRSAGGK